MSILRKYNYVVALFTILIVLASYVAISASRDLSAKYETIVIENGDTVWEIADDYGVEDVDSFVTWVEDNNEIDANNLKPGQEILIPVEKEQDAVLTAQK